MSLASGWQAVDRRITAWLGRHGVLLSRLSLGVIFLWFGALEFVPNWSPAAELASRTIEQVTFGLVPPELGLLILAGWESLIGLGLLTGKFLRTVSPWRRVSKGNTSSRTSSSSARRPWSVPPCAVGV